MIFKGLPFFIVFWVTLFCGLMVACSSNPPQKMDSQEIVLTSADSIAIATAINSSEKTSSEQTPKPVQNLDIAHQSFIRAMEMELRGEYALAEVFWQRAFEADPENRYLSFEIAKRVAYHGEDSIALLLAQRANDLPGKTSVNQYELLANLYVKAGVADSARKYFNLALDSSHYQDMPLVYDYSLFLEAVKDTNELIRVNDILLPQLNYISTLFVKQLGLLAATNNDSAIIELYSKNYEHTNNDTMLVYLVRFLAEKNLLEKVKSITDTISKTTPQNEYIILLYVNTISQRNEDEAYQYLKKKIYEDNVKTSFMLQILASFEYRRKEFDSSKKHSVEICETEKNDSQTAAYSCRVAAEILLLEENSQEALLYVLKADSLDGKDKDFLATVYGYAGMYPEAYHILDSLLHSWTFEAPITEEDDEHRNTIAFLSQVEKQKHQKDVYRLQKLYAQFLVSEAKKIEDDIKSDSHQLEYAHKRRTEAQLLFEQLLDVDSTNYNVRFSMAVNLDALENYEECFKNLDWLLRVPEKENFYKKSEVYNFYGYTLIRLNRTPEELDKGILFVDKAIELEKENVPDAYIDSKAWGLYYKGNFEEAYSLMKQIKADKFLNDYEYWEHIAAIQEALGLIKEATESYRHLLKLKPNHKKAKAFLKNSKK